MKQRVPHWVSVGRMFSRGAGLAFIIYAASAGGGYVINTLLTRLMSVGEYGTYTYISSWSELLAIVAGLGLSGAALRYIPQYGAQSRLDLRWGFVTSSYAQTLSAGVAVVVLGGLLMQVGLLAGDRHGTWWIGLSLIPVHAIVTLQMQLARSVGRIGAAYAPPMVFRHVLVAAGCIVLVLLGKELDAYLALVVLLATMTAIMGYQALILRGEGQMGRHCPKPSYALREWHGVALPLLLISLSMQLLTRLDVLVLGAFRGPEDVGVYNIATKSSALANFAFLAVNAAMAPQISALHATNRLHDLQEMVKRASIRIFYPSLAIGILVIGLGQWVLGIFGAAYQNGYGVMVLLVLGHVAAAAFGLAPSILNMTGHQNACVIVYTLTTVANLLLNILLVPRFGAFGAAISTVTAQVFCHASLSSMVRRRLGLRSTLPLLPMS